jgi:hypothetical protein
MHPSEHRPRRRRARHRGRRREITLQALDAVALHQIGKESGINYAVTAGFRPAMWTCACLARRMNPTHKR